MRFYSIGSAKLPLKTSDDDTYAIYVHNIKAFIGPYFSSLGIPVSEVKTSTLEAYYNHLKRDHALQENNPTTT